MTISDKQELRRCVKQLVRRAGVSEAFLDFDVAQGELGVAATLDLFARPAASPNDALLRAMAEQTPFDENAAAAFAAFDALGLPVHDLNRAQTLQQEYERAAYLREILDAMRARCVLVRVPLEDAGSAQFEDDRLEPLLCVEEKLFAPGRYGVDYASIARRIEEAASVCGAGNIRIERFDAQALRYCLLPLCQDNGCALHLHLNTAGEIATFAGLLADFDGVHALVDADSACERALIDAATACPQILVCLHGCDSMRYALSRLGTRFVPYAACAVQPEQMLGRWVSAREDIWQTLCEAYLPLARAGFELQSAAIERDVRRLMSENLLALCRPQSV